MCTRLRASCAWASGGVHCCDRSQSVRLPLLFSSQLQCLARRPPLGASAYSACNSASSRRACAPTSSGWSASPTQGAAPGGGTDARRANKLERGCQGSPDRRCATEVDRRRRASVEDHSRPAPGAPRARAVSAITRSMRTKRAYEIDHSELEPARSSAGAFGMVKRARWRGIDVRASSPYPTVALCLISTHNTPHAQVAVKQLHVAVDSHGVADGIDACLRELDMCAKLRHPSVIMLLAAVLDPTDMCIVLEQRGDRRRLIRSKRTSSRERGAAPRRVPRGRRAIPLVRASVHP